MGTKNIGIYVHIPFCKKKCEYCDFKSYTGKESLIEQYIKWVKYELQEVGEGNRKDYEEGRDDLVIVKSIYIGGGTPSIILAKYISEILETIKQYFILGDIDNLEKNNSTNDELIKQLFNHQSIDNTNNNIANLANNIKTTEDVENKVENTEITIEVNPGTVDEAKLKEYKKCGINRLSIGLQSTNDRILKTLGRIHTYTDFLNTYNTARKIGFENINVDLMLGIPNQTIEDVEESINNIIKLSPEHISTYSLILEEGTPFYNKLEANEITLPSDEIERKMYWLVKTKLEEAGYTHYEISNFAKKGYESKHNLACWNQEEYIGIGAAAHSYTNNVRYSNVDTIEEYINNYETGNEVDNIIFHEKQNKTSKMQEFMLLGLRKIDGVHIQDFKNKFGENPIFLYRKELEKLVNENLVEIDGDTIKLTNQGLDLANLVWEEFV